MDSPGAARRLSAGGLVEDVLGAAARPVRERVVNRLREQRPGVVGECGVVTQSHGLLGDHRHLGRGRVVGGGQAGAVQRCRYPGETVAVGPVLHQPKADGSSSDWQQFGDGAEGMAST